MRTCKQEDAGMYMQQPCSGLQQHVRDALVEHLNIFDLKDLHIQVI